MSNATLYTLHNIAGGLVAARPSLHELHWHLAAADGPKAGIYSVHNGHGVISYCRKFKSGNIRDLDREDVRPETIRTIRAERNDYADTWDLHDRFCITT